MSTDQIWILVGLAAVSVALLYFGIRFQMQRDLGIVLLFDHRSYKPGDLVPVKVKIAPKRDIEVNKLTASIYCLVTAENSREGILNDRNDRYFSYERINFTEVNLSGPQVFKAGTSQTLEGTVQIDPQGRGSRENSKLDRNWYLTVDVDIPQCPDVQLKEELKVMSKF